MKIALITEGVSEYKSLPKVIDQLRARSGRQILAPILVNVPPDAAPAIIARHCKPLVALSAKRGAQLVVIVLDREEQIDHPGVLADRIKRAVESVCGGASPHIEVVLKDRMYENWLVADVEGLRSHPRRFKITDANARSIQPDRADRVDGLAILKKAAIGFAYEKVQDSVRIAGSMNVGDAAANSRSLRHFLHVLGDPAYGAGCSRA